MSGFSSDSNGNSPKYGALPSMPDVGNIDINKIITTRPRQPATNGPDYIPYNQRRGRDIYSRLSFNTGIFWLSGFTLGGSYGFVEGWRKAPNPAFKIRLNSVLNGVSSRGSVLGSDLGIIAFLHTASVWGCDNLEVDDRLGTDYASPIISGAITGGLFKSSTGPRGAALASVIGAVLSTAYMHGSTFFTNSFGSGPRF